MSEEKTQEQIDTFLGHLQVVEESEELFRKLFEVIFDGVCINRLPGGEFTKVNPAFIRMSGYEERELYGLLSKEINIWHEPKDRLFVLGELHTKGVLLNFEGRFRTKSGEIRYGLLSAIIVIIKGVEYIISTIRDITEQKQLEERLRQSSITDSLTGLYNSGHFHAQIKKEIKRANRDSLSLTLILIDVDNFKKFNDEYGHLAGDQVLTQFGQVIKKFLRSTDSSYRYGGEEFVIILPSTKKEDGCCVAKKIREKFKKERFPIIKDSSIFATISAGVVEYLPGESSSDFIKRADDLMYRAKLDGKDRVCSEC